MVGSERVGASPFTTGTTAFPARSSAPAHGRSGDEQVTILEGRILAKVAGVQSEPGSMDVGFIPDHSSHRVVNIGDGHLEIPCIHAAAEVTRAFTDTGEAVPHLPQRDKV